MRIREISVIRVLKKQSLRANFQVYQNSPNASEENLRTHTLIPPGMLGGVESPVRFEDEPVVIMLI